MPRRRSKTKIPMLLLWYSPPKYYGLADSRLEFRSYLRIQEVGLDSR